MTVGIGTEAGQYLFLENINGIFVAVYAWWGLQKYLFGVIISFRRALCSRNSPKRYQEG
jgi:hypothetical protein